MILNGVIGKKGVLTFEKRELPFGEGCVRTLVTKQPPPGTPLVLC